MSSAPTSHGPAHAPADKSIGPSKGASRQTINGLAIVGFLAVIFLGIMLIVYGTRYVPGAIARLGSAVYLTTDEETPTPNEEEPDNSVVVPATPTTPTEEEPSEPTTPSTPTYRPPVVVRPVAPVYFGYADLTVDIIAVGYLRTNSPSSFIASSRVPEGRFPAVRFTVRNIGTNISNYWELEADLPTSDNERFNFQTQNPLRPNASKTYTIYFDNPSSGNDERIRIEVDTTDTVRETNENNNTDTATIDIDGDNFNNDDEDISCDIEADDTTIDEGDRTTLRFETDGDIDSASINQGIGSVDEDGGTERVSPREDTTYRMTVRGDGETETCSVTVRVDED